MNIIVQAIIILSITFLGSVVQSFISFPIPGAVIGLLILLALLEFRILALSSIEMISALILGSLSFYFIPPGVELIKAIPLLHGILLKIFFIMIFSTTITMIVTGHVVQFLINKGEK